MTDLRMIRVYLSGPISGYDLAERRALFGVTTDRLVSTGYAVVNPLEVQPKCGKNDCGPDAGHAWECWMRHDLAEMLRCDEVAVLPGWQRSRGAMIETELAKRLGMPVRPVADLLSVPLGNPRSET